MSFPGRWVLILLVLLAAVLPPAAFAAAPPEQQEDLHYQVSLGAFPDVARVHLVLKRLGPGRFLAEFSGAAQGMWRLLNRWLPERYQTEMIYREGRLYPLVYREEFQNQGRRVRKEYRFHHPQQTLEIWRGVDGGPLSKREEIRLSEPVTDPLTLFYNLRLGALGPPPGGETVRIAGIPTPEPHELIAHVGPQTPQGRKVMLFVREKASGKESGPYFIYFKPQWIPNLAWARVWPFGKLMGQLVDDGKIPSGPLDLSAFVTAGDQAR